MSKTLKKKKHWSSKVQECAVSWGGGASELASVVEVRGGAELGEFPHVGQVRSELLTCHLGKIPAPGDVLLEVNGTPVSGLTNRDTLAVIRHFREPVRLKTVKPGARTRPRSPPRTRSTARLALPLSPKCWTALVDRGVTGEARPRRDAEWTRPRSVSSRAPHYLAP
ncbi:membrane-associated guanylate kinase, WW and PDZ domain-containing protein 3-like [Scleropages formosus]|uniref:Membrane-associated guanylate kinase, WW and PDZ domain-containing protein 3-like n=1 Tax=Scleropages formosus TaxID=113540 RepID=A0A0P7WZM1_SCLFO|nr:membrane-associated guanylate kinase, WW and PDZ domain-containing protein 3-like [Scleropages formosus]